MDRYQDAMSMMPDSQNIWSKVQSGLRAFIAKRVATEASVEDLSQEVFVRMQRGLGGLKKESRLVSWIYQIARHAIIDYYRARDRQLEQSVGLGDEVACSAGSVSIAGDAGGLLRDCTRPATRSGRLRSTGSAERFLHGHI